jgi:mannose-6-phosphate isomerase-like protein (cupin superfamily)
MLDTPQFTAPALTNNEMKEQEEALADRKTPYVFSLKGQLLEQGRTDSMLAATDDLTIRLKIYASGGENELHAHTSEDHSFMILQGSGRFFGPEGEIVELGQYEGIMLPKGSYYKFFATSEEPLVMIRVGNPNHKFQPKPNRINIKGEEMKGDSKENKKVDVVFKEGEFFGG